ncbi:MAG TPA: SapB/AmfS family lanthipeptide [Pseudonocardiaceae bacterium]|nr:SapB/AmfS family lanthipeptide [Pseudonocardiaceae bacterium]
MALLDLQEMELPEVSGDPLMASIGDSNSHGSGGFSLISILICL